MSFPDAIRRGFANYLDISGRARRSEFWWWVLFIFASNGLLSWLDTSVFGPTSAPLFGIAFGLLTLLPTISVAGRRLHDGDLSAWWLLLWLVPFVGWFILLVLCSREGTPGDNRFGPDPLGRGNLPDAGVAP